MLEGKLIIILLGNTFFHIFTHHSYHFNYKYRNLFSIAANVTEKSHLRWFPLDLL